MKLNKLKLALILMTSLVFSLNASADSKVEIDVKVAAALEQFKKEVNGGATYLKKASAVLVMPEVLKVGFVVGGEYGEGALLVNNKIVEYYSTASASVGFQVGAQSKAVVLVFLDNAALKKFRKADGWEAGVDGSVALLDQGTGKDISTVSAKDPIVGFVFSNKGLMYNLTIEGSKFTKIVR